jgi:hypothetical protein
MIVKPDGYSIYTSQESFTSITAIRPNERHGRTDQVTLVIFKVEICVAAQGLIERLAKQARTDMESARQELVKSLGRYSYRSSWTSRRGQD